MDRQGPPNRPCYQLTSGLNRFRQRKRCYDVALSRQEGSTKHHLPNAQNVMPQPVETQDYFFCRLVGQSAPTGLAIVHWIGY